jgi:ParB family chromosome partitioning protein
MYARDASFGDDLAEAYGIHWVEDLFAPANEDSRYTVNVEGFLGAQHEWMTQNLPKKGVIVETTNYGEVKLPPKAERVYGKPAKGDSTAMYLDRDGKVQTVHFRLPAPKKPAKADKTAGKPGGASDSGKDADSADDVVVAPTRPDVTQKGVEMIGDFRTDALHEALGRAPIEDGTLMALLVLAFAGDNVTVQSASGSPTWGRNRFAPHAASLLGEDGKLSFDTDTLLVAARSVLVEALSCRQNRTNSGIVARIVGEAIGADSFLPNMGTDDFLSCLSRGALEACCAGTSVPPRQKLKDTRAALVEYFKEGHFVHPKALFEPDADDLNNWRVRNTSPVTDEEADATMDEVDEASAGETVDGDPLSGDDELDEAA